MSGQSKQDYYWDAESAAREMDRLKAELASKQKEIDHWKDLETEAANFVEVPIVMRTHFTGEPPYVGWEGLGLALTETLDELANAKEEARYAYFRGMVAGSEMKSNVDSLIGYQPSEPIEVYSPHTKVIE